MTCPWYAEPSQSTTTRFWGMHAEHYGVLFFLVSGAARLELLNVGCINPLWVVGLPPIDLDLVYHIVSGVDGKNFGGRVQVTRRIVRAGHLHNFPFLDGSIQVNAPNSRRLTIEFAVSADPNRDGDVLVTQAPKLFVAVLMAPVAAIAAAHEVLSGATGGTARALHALVRSIGVGGESCTHKVGVGWRESRSLVSVACKTLGRFFSLLSAGIATRKERSTVRLKEGWIILKSNPTGTTGKERKRGTKG